MSSNIDQLQKLLYESHFALAEEVLRISKDPDATLAQKEFAVRFLKNNGIDLASAIASKKTLDDAANNLIEGLPFGGGDEAVAQ